MKKLLTILMCILLIPMVIAQDPDVIIHEEPQLNWFQKLLRPLQFSALGGTFSESSVTKGDYVNSIVDLKFYHDAEKYKLTFWFMDQGQIGGIAMTRIVFYWMILALQIHLFLLATIITCTGNFQILLGIQFQISFL
jgi:hypothetical protein